jgi:hypothetical protein
MILGVSGAVNRHIGHVNVKRWRLARPTSKRRLRLFVGTLKLGVLVWEVAEGTKSRWRSRVGRLVPARLRSHHIALCGWSKGSLLVVLASA